jgi:syntaxin 7
VTFSSASSIHGTGTAAAAAARTTTLAEDDSSDITAWVTTTIQDQDHDYDLMVRHVSQQIFNISSNIAVLERLIPCLGQRHKDTPEMRESLHAVLNGTQDLVKSAHSLIKALSKYHHPPLAAPQSNIGLRIQPTVSPHQLTSWQRKVLAGRRQTHQRLTKDLTLASKSFQDLQRQAVEAERRQVATLKRLSVSPSLKRLTNYRSGPASPPVVGRHVMEMTQEESEKLPLLGGSSKKQNGTIVSGGTSHATFDGIGLEAHNRELSVQEEALLREILILDGEVAFQESIILEREYEIQKMEDGMGQVLDVMRELGTLVHEQRDGIDYLHDNIAQVRTRTHLAKQEVLKASEYQRRSREKMCYLIMVTSIVGALVMLAFVST